MALDDLRLAASLPLPNLEPQVPTVTSPPGAGQTAQEGAGMSANEELVASGLRVLRGPLSTFVCQGIEKHYGESWWTQGVLETLVSPQTPTTEDVRRYRRLPETGSVEDCAASFDIAVCLILLTKHWFRIFGPMLGEDRKNDRAWAFELMGVRKQNKHLAAGDHASDFAWRALDTMYRLIEPISSDAATDLVALRSSVDLSSYGLAVHPPKAETQQAVDTPTPQAVFASEIASPTPGADILEDTFADVGPDFSNADLRGMNFRGANLAGADFTGADLRDTDLSNANLAGAVFGGTRLGDGDGNAVIMKGATLDGATLNFAGTSLRYADLSGLNLAGADFTEADLRDTNLSKANLSSAVFGGTRLGDGDGNAVIMNGATLEGATLDFKKTSLRYADFSGLNLEGADFEGADLRDANLSGSILRAVNLKGARVADADTTDVRWT